MPRTRHTALEEQVSRKRSHSESRPSKAALVSSSNPTTATIQTVQADDSLQVFPSSLKTQLDSYLQSPGANIRSFTTSSALDTGFTANGEPTCFVELGTSKMLDCGQYHLDLTSHSSNIVVVKPRPGSTFNDGEPAIITYFGKGMKRQNTINRKIVSRWAIWSPAGVKQGILVERMITGSTTQESTAPPDLKRKRTSDKADLNGLSAQTPADAQANNEDSMFRETIRRKFGDTHHQAVTKEEKGSSIEDTDSQSSSAIRSFSASQPVVEAPNTSTSTQVINSYVARGTPATHPFSRPSTEPQDYMALQALQRTPCSNAALLEFKLANEDQARLVKTIAQCNTVQKLFAYARKAGISDPSTILLRATFAHSETHEIVRDDEDDFEELKNIAQQLFMSAGMQTSNIISIVPVDY